jgi:hypothetical protein
VRRFAVLFAAAFCVTLGELAWAIAIGGRLRGRISSVAVDVLAGLFFYLYVYRRLQRAERLNEQVWRHNA